MIRVLTFAPQITDGTSFYRLGGVTPYLEKEYSDIHIKDLSWKDSLEWADFISYDDSMFCMSSGRGGGTYRGFGGFSPKISECLAASSS